jgi:hypothetical protein
LLMPFERLNAPLDRLRAQLLMPFDRLPAPFDRLRAQLLMPFDRLGAPLDRLKGAVADALRQTQRTLRQAQGRSC